MGSISDDLGRVYDHPQSCSLPFVDHYYYDSSSQMEDRTTAMIEGYRPMNGIVLQ